MDILVGSDGSLYGGYGDDFQRFGEGLDPSLNEVLS
jgi:hypothetical protein